LDRKDGKLGTNIEWSVGAIGSTQQLSSRDACERNCGRNPDDVEGVRYRLPNIARIGTGHGPRVQDILTSSAKRDCRACA
jgi:hypothetical protein